MVKGLLGVLTAARGKRREKAEGDDGWTEWRYWGRLETVELIVFYPCKIKVICAHRPPRFLHFGDEVVQCCICVRTLARGLATRTPMVKGLLGVLTAARGKRREKAEGDDGWTEWRYWGRLETVELIVFYPCTIKVICAHRPPRYDCVGLRGLEHMLVSACVFLCLSSLCLCVPVGGYAMLVVCLLVTVRKCLHITHIHLAYRAFGRDRVPCVEAAIS
ncbi:hypothetical protein NDU88_002680 [Pleurodeles waltl]|uniref:Uncharacterized protein n=1 Tax=Pleurodeles waltl TaxID=8319 RepID=A0AAV7WSE0_PLEWA|nr:hypothetical protein NDU88_002680 [Pleurodeles waltl]